MAWAASGAGVGRRANNSFAGVAGSAGLASGGSGCGLTEPLSWARAPIVANKNAIEAARIARVTSFSPPSNVPAPADEGRVRCAGQVRLIVEHDLFRKPVSTFRDHARNAALPA